MHFAHQGALQNQRKLSKAAEGIWGGIFDSEQSNDATVTALAKSWIDLINDKGPELRKDNI